MRVILAGVVQERLLSMQRALESVLPPSLICATWSPDVHTRESDAVILLRTAHVSVDAQQQEQTLRAQLTQQGVAFQVIDGDSTDAFASVRHAIAKVWARLAPDQAQAFLRQEIMPRWHGVCEGCSDPACERRLFGALLQASDSLHRSAGE